MYNLVFIFLLYVYLINLNTLNKQDLICIYINLEILILITKDYISSRIN